jgi:hypothetical protein
MYGQFKDFGKDEWFLSMKKNQTEAKIKEELNIYSSKDKVIYLLKCWYNNGTLGNTSLCGAFTSKKEAIYYCVGQNKNEKREYILYYIEPFYCNTNFYLLDANGNSLIEKYKPKNKLKNK